MSDVEYLISLLNSVINNKPMANAESDVDFEKVFEIARRHSVAEAAFYGIEKLEVKPDEKIYAKWKEKHSKGIVKSIRQLAELAEISRIFSENHIIHLPLKGCILKHMYERADMRTMADLDILIDRRDQKKVKHILTDRGYKCEHYGKSNHDIYKKEPVYNIEIHTALFGNWNDKEEKYYKDFLTRTNAGENEYARVMSDEDFYVYNIAHFGKHFKSTGSGIRSIMDVYVMRRAFDHNVDRSYIERELSKLGLLEFEKNVAKLSDCWFGNGVSDSSVDETASYIVGSGTYGTFSNYVDNKIKEEGKLKCFLHNIFPTYKTMAMMYPVLKKAPLLLPLIWIRRLLIRPFENPKKVYYEIKTVIKAIIRR